MKSFLMSLAILFSVQSRAALGDRVSSVDVDRVGLGASQKAVQKAASSAAYTVQEITTDNNKVREYISSEGVVFAVTWQGIKRPDLSVLLGSYYDEYSVEDAKVFKSAVSRQPLNIKTSSIVVHHSGHMRDLRGRAFINSLVPAGVNVEALP